MPNQFKSRSDALRALGLSPTCADSVEIREQFLKLIRRYHPDNARTGDAIRARALIEAKELLADEDFSDHEVGPSPSCNGAPVDVEVNIPFKTAYLGGFVEADYWRGGGEERVSIKVPRGTRTGSVIRLRGLGEPGINGGTSGDLLVHAHVAPAKAGADISINVLIDYKSSLSASEVGRTVKTSYGKEEVLIFIPPRVSHGQVLTVKGRGDWGDPTQPRGDLHVRINVDRPLAGKDLHTEVGINMGTLGYYFTSLKPKIHLYDVDSKEFAAILPVDIWPYKSGRLNSLKEMGESGDPGQPAGDLYFTVYWTKGAYGVRRLLLLGLPVLSFLGLSHLWPF
jgi:DnaJ-class molecular chaperone